MCSSRFEVSSPELNSSFPPTKKSEPYIEQTDYIGRFDPIYDEDESDMPWFVGFDRIPNRVVDEEFREVWMSAMGKGMERAEKAP